MWIAHTVLAQKRMNFTGHQVRIDIRQHLDSGKLLGNAARRNLEGHVGGPAAAVAFYLPLPPSDL